MRRSDRTAFGGGSGHPSRRHRQGARRGERSTQRTSGPFNSYDDGSNMENGMVAYDSSDEDGDTESEMMHRRSGREEDLYRQSLQEYGYHRHQHQLELTFNSGGESDEDAELARGSGGHGYGAYRSGNGRSSPFHSGSEHRPTTRHGPSSSSYNNFETGRARFDGRPLPGPRSNHGPRDGGSRVPSTDPRDYPPNEEHGPAWWVEENRSARQSNPSQTALGYWTMGNDPEGDPIFVPSPTLDSSYAGRIERYRNSMRGLGGS